MALKPFGKTKTRSKLSLTLTVIGVWFLASALVGMAQNPGSNITVCTGAVGNNPAKCSGSYPTPSFSWSTSGSSWQVGYQLQVDDNSDFSSPAINVSGGGEQTYQVSGPGLNFGTLYYWRVAVLDNYSSWTPWAQADAPFTTCGSCPCCRCPCKCKTAVPACPW